MDGVVVRMLGIILGTLVVATLATVFVRWRATSERGRALSGNLTKRVSTWWVMVAIFAASLLTGGVGTVVLFALLSFMALREYLTLTPTRRADRGAMLLVFFLVLPLQYVFVGTGWTELFAVFVPVWAFVLIPFTVAAAGDVKDFLSRTSRVQWGVVICVYFLSHVPALLLLERQTEAEVSGVGLLCYFVMIVQGNDVLQYTAGSLLGRRPMAPSVSPNKTREGLAGGLVGSAVLGAALWWVTPFSPVVSAAVGAAIAIAGTLGDLTMSAIKRDLGVKDYSDTIPGHGGVIDRLDSVVFAAPVFYRIVRLAVIG